MQEIHVASVSTKTAKNGSQFTVITDTKGAKFSGFEDGLAKVKEGDVLTAEVEVEGKYTNIVAGKWTIKSRPATTPAASAPTVASTAGAAKSYSEPDRTTERRSIEAQTAFKGIMEVAANGKDILQDADFKRVFGLALKWAEVRLAAKPLAAPLVAGATGAFRNAGEFYAKVAEVFSLNKTQVLARPHVGVLAEAGKFEEAFAELNKDAAFREGVEGK